MQKITTSTPHSQHDLLTNVLTLKTVRKMMKSFIANPKQIKRFQNNFGSVCLKYNTVETDAFTN